MVTVEKAYKDLFERTFPLLNKFNNPYLAKEDFKRLFDTQWSSDYNHCGYVLIDKEQVVGFLGALFSERVIEGKLYKFCNLTSWIVEEGYRQHSLRLLFPVLKLKDITIVNLSPSKEASIIFKKFKFKTLEKAYRIFLFFPHPHLSIFSGFNISNDKDVISSRLNEKDLTFFHDHCSLYCKHLLIYNKHNDDYCYIIFNKIKKKIWFTQILYVSNVIVFKKLLPRIKFSFFKQNKTFFTIIDNRFLKDVSFFGFKYQLKYPRLYRSDVVEDVDKIDNLYTEMYLLKS